ncbi:MAG TPA: hypothetical protein VIJ13_02855, partial [Actinomycetota bacterium]
EILEPRTGPGSPGTTCSTCIWSWSRPTGGRVSRRRAAEAPDPVGSGGRPRALEVALPLWLAILLGTFWLAVLVTVAFTVWRMVANLKALAASVQALSERLTPALEELSAASQETADHAARLSERGASAAEQR